jgi:hypothetical protein
MGDICYEGHADVRVLQLTHKNENVLYFTRHVRGLSKKYPTISFPAVSNGERVGKLSVVVEGTFMRMRDFLLPRNTAGCVCRCQIAKPN